ncbi:hypothetical protein PHYNN_205 [Pantoea phage Phynn]|nr:hypothetical protein PHYNN_205 [Pantoea phage Phynn]
MSISLRVSQRKLLRLSHRLEINKPYRKES